MDNRLQRIQGSAERTARALIARTDVRVVVAGDGASYSWRDKTLTVPAFNKEPEDPRLRAAWRGLLDHECGHVLYSDFAAADAWIARAEKVHGAKDFLRIKGFWNAFEDIYMEKRMMGRHVGCEQNIRTKREYLHARTGGAAPTASAFIPENGTTPIGPVIALQQAILRVGNGGMMEAEIADPDIAAAFELCREEIERGYAATTTQECIDAAEALWRKLQQEAEKPEEEQPEPEPGDGKPGDEGEGGGSEEGDSSGAGEQDGDEPGEGGSEEKESDEEGDEGASGGNETGDADSKADKGTERGKGEDGEGEAPAPAGGDKAGQEGDGKGDGEAAGARPGNEFIKGVVRGDFSEMEPLEGYLRRDAVAATGRVYTVSPESAKRDTVETPALDGATQRRFAGIKRAAGLHGKRLASFCEGAFHASRQSVRVGNMEEGEWIDDDALPGLSVGTERERVFANDFCGIDESCFMCVLIDCSGSMGYNRLGGDSTEPGQKAEHAAVMGYVLHDALKACRIPHAVLGFTTPRVCIGTSNPGYSRHSYPRREFIFVPAPGLMSPGTGLGAICGSGNNLDGESVLWAAGYAAEQGRDADRIILIVVSDGEPAGADDGSLDDQYLTDAVERVARSNIEVYGVGIKVEQSILARFYPDKKAQPGRCPTGHVTLDAKGLTDGILRSLAALITRGYGMTRKGGFGT